MLVTLVGLSPFVMGVRPYLRREVLPGVDLARA